MNNVMIHPNPVDDVLNIDTDLEISRITIHRATGQVVMVSNQKRIDTSGLRSGMYFLRIEFANSQVAVHKFVKQ